MPVTGTADLLSVLRKLPVALPNGREHLVGRKEEISGTAVQISSQTQFSAKETSQRTNTGACAFPIII